jgi:hypothetical protein
MVVGVLRVRLAIRGAYSLKDRRRALTPLKERLRHHFNVAVAEIEERDHWQSAELGICTIGMEQPVINSLLSSVVKAVSASADVELVHYEMEFF